MTAPLALTHTALLPRHSAWVFCPICASIRRLSDGQRTLAEIAQMLHLPLGMCEFLVRHLALPRQWLVRANPQHVGHDLLFWPTLQGVMTELLGDQGAAVLQRASLMIRNESGQVPDREINHLLIAVELAAEDRSRSLLAPHLDVMRRQYAG